MRLNQFISLYSNYSRREADRLILDGKVKINHQTATLHTTLPHDIIAKPNRVHKDFKIFIENKELKYYKKNTGYTAIVYHKPKGELVSKKDIFHRKTIYQSLNSKYQHFMPVGRLDFASEGLLILSDNKDVISKLMHSNLTRVYLIKLDTFITKKMIEAMHNGLTLKNAKAGGHNLSRITQMEFAPMQFEIIKNGAISKLKIFLTEGKNRELRRFFAHFHANVLDLRRVSYGFIHLNALPVGKTRFFTKQEYRELKEYLTKCTDTTQESCKDI